MLLSAHDPEICANCDFEPLQLKELGFRNFKASYRTLTRGAGAQFALSLPHGALSFATLETVKEYTSSLLPPALAPVLDFFSSTVGTVICSVISTPQMVLTGQSAALLPGNRCFL